MELIRNLRVLVVCILILTRSIIQRSIQRRGRKPMNSTAHLGPNYSVPSP
jgi:hypothetical protein